MEELECTGSFVHQAVVKNGEKKIWGCTIHYIDENYDEGETILIKELELR